MPFVVLALGDAGGIALMQLRDGEALPFAEGDFRKPRVAPVTVTGKTERRAQQLHGLAGALERARHIIEAVRIAIIAHEQIAQDVAAMACLAPGRVH